MQLAALALVAWTHAGWDLFLRLALRLGWGRGASAHASPRKSGDKLGQKPRVTVIVAAYAEEGVIAQTVAALLAQEHPCRVVVACDGSPDATPARAREAGAHLVLELPRGGKHAAQAAAVALVAEQARGGSVGGALGDEQARGGSVGGALGDVAESRAGGAPSGAGDLLAFCDANTTWAPGALTALAGAFADPAVGYACGHVGFRREGDTATPNQEGAYWSRELAARKRESDWHSVTAGNGAIYALRAALWPRLRTDLGHDLALPHQVVRHGHLAVDIPEARASELMVPSLEGEWRRKRRMMARAWGIIARDPASGGLLDPRGLPPRYLLALASHRWLRYASPFLHIMALLAGARRAARGQASRADRLALAAQLAVLAGAALPSLGEIGSPGEPISPSVRRVARAKAFLLCRYYVLVTASIAAGLADRLRDGPPEAGWAPAEGTR